MWSRALEYLPKIIDTIPHLERFSQLADKVLASGAASDAAQASLAEAVDRKLGQLRDDLSVLGKDTRAVASSHTELSARINALQTHMTTIEGAAAEARTTAIAVGQSIVSLDREIRSLRTLVLIALVLAVLVALMLGWLLLKHAG